MRQVSAWARHKTLLFAAGAVVLGAIILAWSFLGSSNQIPTTGAAPVSQENDGVGLDITTRDAERAPTQPSEPKATAQAEFVIVYISGAVQRPDVYRVPAVARVKDVVLAAGGLTEDAAADKINLADHVADAQHIHIPHQDEPAPAEAPAGDSTAPNGKGELLNINTASAAELDGLPGIGQSFAQRIVEYRTTNGPFQSVEDLQKVKGIGPALFAKIAPLVTVGP